MWEISHIIVALILSHQPVVLCWNPSGRQSLISWWITLPPHVPTKNDEAHPVVIMGEQFCPIPKRDVTYHKKSCFPLAEGRTGSFFSSRSWCGGGAKNNQPEVICSFRSISSQQNWSVEELARLIPGCTIEKIVLWGFGNENKKK